MSPTERHLSQSLAVSNLEASRRDQQGSEEIAAIAKALCAEAEMTASNLRADLVVATGRVCNVQEQLDHQIELASGKDSIIQSIIKESWLAHTRLRIERNRWLYKAKEMRRLAQEAQDAQERLGILHDTLSQLRSDRQSPTATTPLRQLRRLGYLTPASLSFPQN